MNINKKDRIWVALAVIVVLVAFTQYHPAPPPTSLTCSDGTAKGVCSTVSVGMLCSTTSPPTLSASPLCAPPPPPPPATYFRDNFNGIFVDPTWEFSNPLSDSPYSLVTEHIVLQAAANKTHDCWTGISTCTRLVRSAFPNGVYEAKFDGQNVSSKYQSYGVTLIQDASNYIRYEYGSDGSVVRVGAYKIVNGTGSVITQTTIGQQQSIYLRIVKVNTTLSFKHSLDGNTWVQTGSAVSLPTFVVNKAGVNVDNAGLNRTTVANVDYFSMNATGVN